MDEALLANLCKAEKERKEDETRGQGAASRPEQMELHEGLHGGLPTSLKIPGLVQ